MKKVALFWSGGKDASLALHELLQNPEMNVVQLVGTFHRFTNRLAMHGVRPEVIREQARQIGVPLHEMWVEEEGNEGYEKALRITYQKLVNDGIEYVAYGDIFLDSLRQYRKTFLDEFPLEGLYPLWKVNTRMLADKYIRLGFQSILVCVDDKYFGKKDIFKSFSFEFLNSLPKKVDPCGENGEFHTLCLKAPYFSQPVEIQYGEIIHRDLGLDPNNTDTKIGFFFGDIKTIVNI